MSNDVSIFFDRRKIVLTESIKPNFNKDFGLFTRYSTPPELSKILDFFQSTTLVQNVFISGKDMQTMIYEFSCMFHLIEAAGGLVQNRNGDLLIIYRYGKWDLPKGKLELNERIEVAALREVSEETGIKNINLGKYITATFHTYRLGNATILKKTHWYSMYYDGNEKLIPQQSEDISIAKWVAKNQMNEVLNNTYDTIRDVLCKAEVLNDLKTLA